MNVASVTDEAGSHADAVLGAAVRAVSCLVNSLEIVVFCWTVSRNGLLALSNWPPLLRQLRQQFVHEFLAEVELAGTVLRDRSGLEGDGRKAAQPQPISRERS
jgi:hypothetical protein